jgi:hypothetical protein
MTNRGEEALLLAGDITVHPLNSVFDKRLCGGEKILSRDKLKKKILILLYPS